MGTVVTSSMRGPSALTRVKPGSPALEGGFLTTRPPEKFHCQFFFDPGRIWFWAFLCLKMFFDYLFSLLIGLFVFSVSSWFSLGRLYVFRTFPFYSRLSNWLLFSHQVVSDSLRPHGLQHARPFCPSPSSGVCPSSCPLSRWSHPAISSSATLFSFCLQSFPASGSFPMSWLFASGGQSIGASASASVLPVSIQGWFPLGWTGLISLISKRLSRILSSTTVQRCQFFGILPPLWSNSHIHYDC